MKKKLFILPTSTLSWKKVADYEKQTALFLAKNNFVIIIFFDKIKNIFLKILSGKIKKVIEKEKKNLFLVEPVLLLPFNNLFCFKKINAFFLKAQLLVLTKLIKKSKSKSNIIWTQYPADLEFIPFLPKGKIIYDIVDFYYSKDKKTNHKLKNADESLIKKADWLFVNSQALLKIKKRQFPQKKFFLVPQGFRKESFENKKPPSISLKKRFKKIPQPIIGYLGEIGHRIDYPLLIDLIRKNKDWSFVFVGPQIKTEQEDKMAKTGFYLKNLKSLPNFFLIKRQRPNQIASLINFFNICLVPYNVKHKFNLYSYPMKIFEYFYPGKPVVSTPILELKRLQPYVKIAKNAEEFKEEIKKILKEGWPKEYQQKQKKMAIANSWENKIEKISEVLEREFPEKPDA